MGICPLILLEENIDRAWSFQFCGGVNWLLVEVPCPMESVLNSIAAVRAFGGLQTEFVLIPLPTGVRFTMVHLG